MMVPKGLSNLCWVECQKVSRLRGAFLTYSPYAPELNVQILFSFSFKLN